MKDSAMLGDLQYPPWQLRFGANVRDDGSVEFRDICMFSNAGDGILLIAHGLTGWMYSRFND